MNAIQALSQLSYTPEYAENILSCVVEISGIEPLTS